MNEQFDLNALVDELRVYGVTMGTAVFDTLSTPPAWTLSLWGANGAWTRTGESINACADEIRTEFAA